MKRVLALRPSPAMAVACLALFVALGGVSYGVATGAIGSREIRDNTVRSRDLRNNDVRTGDIRNSTIRGRDVAINTLTGIDISEKKLGKVPSASFADSASASDNASRLGGIGPSGFLRPKTSPFVTLAPGTDWETVPGSPGPGYFLDPIGFVHLHGAVLRVAGNADLAVTLPAGARPSAVKRFPVYGEGGGAVVEVTGVRIDPNGNVVVTPAGAGGKLVSLEGVTFRAGD